MKEFWGIHQAAEKLGKSVGWLNRWLNEHPRDEYDQPCYRLAGRDKIIDEPQLERIRRMIEAEAIRRLGAKSEARTQPGLIYFIEAGDFIKIGYSRSMEARLHKMATDVPGELKVLHVEPGTFKQEKIFHRHFAAIRGRGEWFRKTPELLEFIGQRKRFKEAAG